MFMLILGVLYASIETSKYLAMRKNGKALNGIHQDVSLLKLEEERHINSMKAIDHLTDWQKDIHNDLENLVRENSRTHVDIGKSLDRLSNNMKLLTRAIEAKL